MVAKMSPRMTTISGDDIRAAVAGCLSPPRWRHTMGVVETAVALAIKFGESPERVRLAGLLHDYAREMEPAALLDLARRFGLETDPIESREPLLLHGKVGAALARERFAVTDQEVLTAVALHITGAPGMSRLAKVVFLADFIEPGRGFATAGPARAASEHDLDRAVFLALQAIMVYVISRGFLLHPRTTAAYNEHLLLTKPGGV